MKTVPEAARLINEYVARLPDEVVALDSAAGRVLRRDVLAERDIPAFDRVTMDGIAVAWQSIERGCRSFTITATQAAGVPPHTVGAADQCIRVMTGAVLPQGTDTVIPVERIESDGATARVSADAAIHKGQFIHRRGSDTLQGSVVISAGTVAGPPEVAVLASVGQSRVTVSQMPRIAVISTGDELVSVDDTVQAHQIRSSNGRAIEAALRLNNCGIVTRRRLRDEPEQLLGELEALHATNDVLILSGGVSMGEFDFVPAALERLGAQLIFHRISQKPGRPMWFGISGDNKPIFALPGNPVSTLVCMARYVIPALRNALGSAPQKLSAVLAETMTSGPSDFTWFVPVRLHTNSDGQLLASPCQINTSGDFSALVATAGIAELGTTQAQRTRGAVVEVFRW